MSRNQFETIHAGVPLFFPLFSGFVKQFSALEWLAAKMFALGERDAKLITALFCHPDDKVWGVELWIIDQTSEGRYVRETPRGRSESVEKPRATIDQGFGSRASRGLGFTPTPSDHHALRAGIWNQIQGVRGL